MSIPIELGTFFNVFNVNKNEDKPMRKAKTIYSELAVARESVTFTYILSKTQRQTEEWDSFLVEKGKALGMPWLVVAAMWNLQGD